MRRLLVLLLMFLLPLQWSWSAAASLCAHETVAEAATKHFGHHTHAHAESGTEPATASHSEAGQVAEEVECGVCHLLCGLMTPPVVAIRVTEPATERHAGFRSDVPCRSVDTPFRPPFVEVA